MRTLTNTPLFGMFTSYVEGSELMPGNLPAAYDDFCRTAYQFAAGRGHGRTIKTLELHKNRTFLHEAD